MVRFMFLNHVVFTPALQNLCVKSVQIRSFSGPYFPVFSPNTGKRGPEKTPSLDTFYAVLEKSTGGKYV